MNDSNSEMDRLIAELAETRKEINREIDDLSPHWGISRPFPLYIVNPDAIALLYGIFLVACFALGIVFTFHAGTLGSLGIALIVGALFAGGAVVGWIWGFALQKRVDLFDKAFSNEGTKNLEDLGQKYWQLKEHIDHLRKELPSEGSDVHPEDQ